MKTGSGALLALIAAGLATGAFAGQGTRDPLIEKGWKLVQAGKMSEAEALFKNAAASAPGNVSAHRAYLIVAANLGRAGEVEAEYAANELSHPNDGLAVYLHMLALNDARREVALVDRAQKAMPGDPWVRLMVEELQAARDIREGRDQEALTLMEQPARPELEYDRHQLRVWAFSDLGRLADSEREVRAQIEAFPFDSSPYDALAGLSFGDARFDDSLKAADQSLKLRDSATARGWRMQALKAAGRTPESFAEIEKIVVSTPVTAGDYGALAGAFSTLDRSTEAWEAQSAARDMSLDLGAAAALAMTEAPILGLKRARADCDALLKINPRSADALMTSATLHCSDGRQCEKAVAEFDAVLKTYPRNVYARTGKIMPYVQSDRFAPALEAAQSALELAPKDWEILFLAGLSAYRLDRIDLAADYLRRSAAAAPRDSRPYLLLALVELMRNRGSEAESAIAAARKNARDQSEKELQEDVVVLRATAESQRHLHLELKAEPPPSADYSKAPAAVREFVRVGLSTANSSEVYALSAVPVYGMGAAAIPWVKRVLLDGDESLHPQSRALAADLLSRRGRWDDLMDALRAPGFGPSFAAQGPLGGAPSRYLPDIETVARTSLNPHSRVAATWVLERTKDARYTPVMASNLFFSEVATRVLAARRRPLGAEKGAALQRFLKVCADPDDLEVRTHSMRALERMGDTSAVPALLDAAEHASLGFHRREALHALSSITQESFGDPTGQDAGKTRTLCADSASDVWRIVDSTETPDALTAVARRVEDSLARDLAGTPDARALGAWRAWLSGRRGDLPARFEERVVSVQEFPKTRTTLTLYSSGKLKVRGVAPGIGGESTFTDLESYEHYVESIGADWLQGKFGPEAAEASRWVKSDAIPKLRADWAAKTRLPAP